MARRALIVGTGVADRIAAGLSGWEIERTPGVEPLDLVVWADYPMAACTPRRLTDLSLAEWDEACDRPLRAVIDLPARRMKPWRRTAARSSCSSCR